MTAQELIEKLGEMPPEATVVHLWDGEPRTGIEHVWLSRDGEVVTADKNMVVYSTGARPTGAMPEDEDPYWRTPS